MAERVGVLVMAHGTPASPADIEAFYTRIRRGRPPSPEQLADLEARYRAIGGTSPLTERTRSQVDGLRRVLERRQPGRFDVRYGAKHVEPSIEEAAASVLAGAPDLVVGLVLTPHWSSMGSGEYLRRAADALDGRVPLAAVPQWYDEPGLVALLAERVRAALDALDAPDDLGGPGDRGTVVLFTAHSLPERVRAHQDPYESQVEASAASVAEAAGVHRWRVAWQSAGRTPEPWIGPDLLDVLRALPDEGVRRVVVCPVGFVADHLEVLYDIDVEARRVAEAAGLRLVRTASLNDDPRFLEVLADVTVRAVESPLPVGEA